MAGLSQRDLVLSQRAEAQLEQQKRDQELARRLQGQLELGSYFTKANFTHRLLAFICERSIFQTFWKIHSCTKFLSFELETSNFGSSYVFSSPLKWRGRFLPNLTFWTQKWHISGKMQVLLFQNLESTLLCQIFVF